MEPCVEVRAPFEAIEVNQPAQDGPLLSSYRLRSGAFALAVACLIPSAAAAQRPPDAAPPPPLPPAVNFAVTNTLDAR